MRYIFSLLLFVTLQVVTLGQNDGKKNILFIAVDDLKPLLSNYGCAQMHTPNFDRLAAMGATFTNAHVQQAVCGPSRASIMTGTYPDVTRVWDLHTDFRKSNPELISMPEYLISQGYETAAVGKIYHKGSAAEGHDGKSWSIPHKQPKNFDPAFGEPAFSFYQAPETKSRVNELIEEAKAKGIKGPGKQRNYAMEQCKPSTECIEASDEAYLDGLYTKSALNLMRQLKKGDKPFFLAVGYQKPHLPFVAPKKYWDLYQREDIQLDPQQTLASGTPQIAYHTFGELRAFTDIDDDAKLGQPLDEAKQRELIHGYMACVSYIDAQIGKLLDELDRLGLTDNTAIVLWGDHGFHLGDHTLWCKHSNFEQATRIPLMFAGPGVAAGSQISQPVELLDVFPTLFAITGVAPSSQTQGISLLPLLDSDATTTVEKDYAMSAYPRQKKTMGYSIRTDRYRYTEWHTNDYHSTKPYDAANLVGVELYDYEKDPQESINLAIDKAYAPVVANMQQKLKAHLDKQVANR
ncbi:MAG: sulfatase [Saprospiraceae bacterium]